MIFNLGPSFTRMIERAAIQPLLIDRAKHRNRITCEKTPRPNPRRAQCLSMRSGKAASDGRPLVGTAMSNKILGVWETIVRLISNTALQKSNLLTVCNMDASGIQSYGNDSSSAQQK